MASPLSPLDLMVQNHERNLDRVSREMMLHTPSMLQQQSALGQAQSGIGLSSFGSGLAAEPDPFRESQRDRSETIMFRNPEPLTIRMELQKDTDEWLEDVEL